VMAAGVNYNGVWAGLGELASYWSRERDDTPASETIEFVAQRRYAYMGIPYFHIDFFQRNFDMFREAAQKNGYEASPYQLGWLCPIYVAESDRQARAGGEYHWKNFWERRGGARTYGAHGSTGLSTILDGSRRQELMDMEHSIAEGSFICGAPETVVGQIKKIATEAGADTFLGEFTFGELTQRQAMNSLGLFAERVMPELKQCDIDALNFPQAQD